MKNVTKQDLIQESSRSSGRSQAETRAVIEEFMKVVADLLEAGRMIEIRGFGTFYAKDRKPRPARNPRTGEVCPLGPRRVPLFRFSPDVRLHVHEIPELQEAVTADEQHQVFEILEGHGVENLSALRPSAG